MGPCGQKPSGELKMKSLRWRKIAGGCTPRGPRGGNCALLLPPRRPLPPGQTKSEPLSMITQLQRGRRLPVIGAQHRA